MSAKGIPFFVGQKIELKSGATGVVIKVSTLDKDHPLAWVSWDGAKPSVFSCFRADEVSVYEESQSDKPVIVPIRDRTTQIKCEWCGGDVPQIRGCHAYETFRCESCQRPYNGYGEMLSNEKCPKCEENLPFQTDGNLRSCDNCLWHAPTEYDKWLENLWRERGWQ